MEAIINVHEDLSPKHVGHLAIKLLVRADFVRCGRRLAFFDGAAAGRGNLEIRMVVAGMDSHYNADSARHIIGNGERDGGGYGHCVFDHGRNAVPYVATIRAETPA